MDAETNIKCPIPALQVSPKLLSNCEFSQASKSTDVHTTAEQCPINQSTGICDKPDGVCDLMNQRDVATDSPSNCSDEMHEVHGRSLKSLESKTIFLKHRDCNNAMKRPLLLQSPLSLQQLRPKNRLEISTTRSVADIIDEANGDSILVDNAEASMSPVCPLQIVEDKCKVGVENAEFDNNDDGGPNIDEPLRTKEFLFGSENENIEVVSCDDESEEANAYPVKRLFAEPAMLLQVNEVDENTDISVSNDESDDSIAGQESTEPLADPKSSSVHKEANTSYAGSDNDDAPKATDVSSSSLDDLIPNRCESPHESTGHDSDIPHEISRGITADVDEISLVPDSDMIRTCSLQAIKVRSYLHPGKIIQNVDQWATEFSMFPRDDYPICQLQFLLK